MMVTKRRVRTVGPPLDRRWLPAVGLAALAAVLLAGPVVAQDRGGGRARDRSRGSAHPFQASSRPVRLPDLGQRHPLIQVTDLDAIVTALDIAKRLRCLQHCTLCTKSL